MSKGGASSLSDAVKEIEGSGVAEGIGTDAEGRQMALLEVYQHLKVSSTPAQFLKDENVPKFIPSFSTVVANNKKPAAKGPDEEESMNFSYKWTLNSHVRLLFAIFDYATKKASPKKLMKLMGFMPETLTSEHVKSHLQKFRVHYKKTRDPEYEKLKEAGKESRNLTPTGSLSKIVHTYPVQNCVMDYFRTARQAEVQKSSKPKKGRKRAFSEFALDEPAQDKNREFLPKMMQKHRETMKLHERNRLRYSYKAAEQFETGDDCLEIVNDVIGALDSLTPKHHPEEINDTAGCMEEISDQVLEDVIFRHIDPTTSL